MLDDAGLQALREAARLSPDNFPLRRHLAEQLLSKGYLAEAEAEFRAALVLAPRDPGITAGLAEAFVRALDRSIEASSDAEAMKEVIVANTETDAELADQIALDRWVADIDRDKLRTVGELATQYGALEAEPDLDDLIWTAG